MKQVLIGLLMLYLITSLYVFASGAVGANSGIFFDISRCMRKPSRIEKFFPAYKLGCYLFSNQENWYYKE